MTYFTEVWIQCDYGNCLRDFGPEGSTASATRKNARREGWRYLNGDDYCPEHADNPFGGESE